MRASASTSSCESAGEILRPTDAPAPPTLAASLVSLALGCDKESNGNYRRPGRNEIYIY